MSSVAIEVDKSVLERAIQQMVHGSVLLRREYMLINERWSETLLVEGDYGSKVRLTINREKV